MQSAWIMFVTDRLRCWANLEKTKCILGMRVKILLARKSQFVQSGIKAAWVLSAESQNCNLQNRKLQKNTSQKLQKTPITNCKKHKSQIAKKHKSQIAWNTNHNGCSRAVGEDGLQMQKLANSKQHSLVGQIHFPLHRKYLKSYIVNISLLQYASLLLSMLVSSLKD